MPTPAEKAAITTEYERLCSRLNLAPIVLDIYECDPSSNGLTAHGTPLKLCDAGYSPSRGVINLPTNDGDTLPSIVPSPPTNWQKFGTEWEVWRIDLWHEVVHQLSNELGEYDPREPARTRDDGSTSSRGHGDGWWEGIQRMATVFSVAPDTLDTLLDR